MHTFRSPVRGWSALPLCAGMALGTLAASSSVMGGVQWAQWTNDSSFLYSVKYMPDFDQHRKSDDPDLVGFPNDGKMYCAPTCGGNALAYIANHGFPEIDPGQAIWGMPWQYNPSGDLILALGTEMGTTPGGGTSTANEAAALLARLQAKFVVNRLHISSTYTPTVSDMALMGMLDYIVLPYYYFCSKDVDDTGDLTLSMNGGHAVTLAYAKADQVDTRVGFRDPADGAADWYSQSSFKTRMWTVAEELAWYGGNQHTMNRFGGTGSNRYLTGYIIIRPKAEFSWHAYDNGFRIHRSANPLGSQQLNQKSIRLPEDTEIVDLVPGPDGLDTWILARKQLHYLLFPISNHDGSIDPSPIEGLMRPVAIAFDRHHTLHVLEEGAVRTFSGDDQSPIGAMPLPSPSPMMVVDDQADELVILLPQTGHLARMPVDHSAALSLHRLPTEVSMSSDMDLAIGADGTVFVLDVQADRAWGVTEREGDLAAEPIGLGVASGGTAIESDDAGDLLVAAGGVLHALTRGADGSWRANPDNVRHGVAVEDRFRINRSRSNLPIGSDVVPTLDEQGEGAEDLLDCDGDIDWNRQVGIDDLLIVLNTWDDQGGSPGDVTNDFRVDVEDVLAVVASWGICPG